MQTNLLMVVGLSMGVAMCAVTHGQAAANVDAAKAAGPSAMSGMGNQANFDQLQEHQRGGMSFMGKVAMQDAMFPWDPIPVIVTCNGVVRYRTEADAKGGFAIQGDASPSELTPVKNNPHQVAASQLVGCDVQASVPGFKSSVVRIINGNIMDNPDVGTITLRPDGDATGSAASATTTTASPEAMKRFNKARAEWLDKNIDGAERDLQKAVQIDPKFADAWYQLGKLQQIKNSQDALNSYEKAVAADPKFVSPYQRIAEQAALQKKWQDVANATAQALKLDPTGTPQIWYFDAVGNYNLGKTDEAEASARKSLAMDPQHLAPNTEQLLAVILAGKGEYAEALKHLQNSLTYVKPGPNADLIKQQIAQLEKALPAGSSN